MMRNQITEKNIYIRLRDQTPRDILMGLLEEEGDILGWEEESLVYESAIRINDLPEAAIKMARFALKGLVRDGLVARDGRLICLKD
jgi:hypothetical protein